MPLSPEQRERFNTACEHIAKGLSLREVANIEGMPSASGILYLMNEDETGAAAERYARAKDMQIEAKVDEMLDVARTEEDVQRARLIVDTIKWTASKLKPKVYGDKVQASVDGTVTLRIERGDPTE